MESTYSRILIFASAVNVLGLSNLLHAVPIQNINLEVKKHYIERFPQTSKSTIPFYWQHITNPSALPSTMGNAWRHNYDFRLLRKNDTLELVSYNGKAQLFTPISTHYFESVNNADTIEKNDQYYQLNSKYLTTVFYGSYPIKIKEHGRPAIKLRYRDGVLTKLFDKNGNELTLNYADNGMLSNIKTADDLNVTFEYDQYNRLASSHSTNSNNQYAYPSSPPVQLCTVTTPLSSTAAVEDKLCNTTENPPPTEFQFSPPSEYNIKLDLRPQSCRSYFIDYNGIDRGVKLEQGMLQHARFSNFIPTVRSFPVVDFIDGREAVAVYSKDLNSKVYNPLTQPDGLYDSIVRDAQDANTKYLGKLETHGSVSVTEKGVTTTITSSQVDGLRMEVMIQAGVATSTQLAQIERARLMLLTKWNIKLITVVIP